METKNAFLCLLLMAWPLQRMCGRQERRAIFARFRTSNSPAPDALTTGHGSRDTGYDDTHDTTWHVCSCTISTLVLGPLNICLPPLTLDKKNLQKFCSGFWNADFEKALLKFLIRREECDVSNVSCRRLTDLWLCKKICGYLWFGCVKIWEDVHIIIAK